MEGNGWIKFTLKAVLISSVLHFFLKKGDFKINCSEVFNKNLSFYIDIRQYLVSRKKKSTVNQ